MNINLISIEIGYLRNEHHTNIQESTHIEYVRIFFAILKGRFIVYYLQSFKYIIPTKIKKKKKPVWDRVLCSLTMLKTCMNWEAKNQSIQYSKRVLPSIHFTFKKNMLVWQGNMSLNYLLKYNNGCHIQLELKTHASLK